MTREQALQNFLTQHGWGEAQHSLLAGDASFRRYERLYKDAEQVVLMDAPPPQENVEPFITIANYLRTQNFSAPEILAEDTAQGFLLLEDLGDARFVHILANDTDSEEILYQAAVDVLVKLHHCKTRPDVAIYDMNSLLEEVVELVDWYLPLVGLRQNNTERQQYLELWKEALIALSALPEVLVLRDYHADNLMWLPEREGHGNVGLLDFQDAAIGSPAYDMVSLLEDARRDVSPALAEKMINHYLIQTGLSTETFCTAYAVLGAQRNCKIIGRFARLAVRDDKPNYLAFLPRVWAYLEQDIEHPALSKINAWLDDLVPADTRNAAPMWPQETAAHG